jgi:nucleoside 2-deoxyribosyltransferase
MTRVYISGPISGTSDFMYRFEDAEKYLTGKGYSVINPVKIGASLPLDMTYEEIMEIDMLLLDDADAIYMLLGWQTSVGANREYGYALGKGKEIMKQEMTFYPLHRDIDHKDNNLDRYGQEGEQNE